MIFFFQAGPDNPQHSPETHITINNTALYKVSQKHTS